MSKWVENIDKKTYLLIDRKGGGGNASSLRMEPSISLQVHAACALYSGGVMPGWRAWSGVGKYNTESSEQGRKRFKKTSHLPI